MRARTKFVIVILAITLILSGVVVASHEIFQRQAVDDANQEVDSTVGLTAEQIDAQIEERRDYVGFVASRTTEDDFNRSDEVLLEITRSTRFYAAQLVDDEGRVVDFQGDVEDDVREETIGTVSEEPFVEAALDGRTFVSEPDSAADGYIIVISAPILDEDGTVQGAIAAAIFVDQQTFLQSTRPLETDSQSVAVIGPNGEEIKPPQQRFGAEITSSAPVESTGWEVTVYRDRGELTDRLQSLAIIQAASLAIVLVTLVGFSVWEYQTNLRQAERLLEGFKALTRGEYDHRLSLSSAEEWQQISDGFGTLATGLAQREAELRERGQRLDVLNRVLRHNVRNEMSVVVNYADLIKTFSDDEQVLTAAGEIYDSGRDLTALSEKANQIRNAFDDADRLVSFDAPELVTDAIDDVADEFPDVEFSTEVDDVTVAGIPSLGTALKNVLENACEHNDADDPAVEIRVEADEDSDRVRLAVADNGPGIPEHEYAVLEKGEETALEHGSGLGMWLIHWVVDRSGGTLEFSENDPRGTVVTVELFESAVAEELDVSPVLADTALGADDDEGERVSTDDDEGERVDADEPDEN